MNNPSLNTRVCACGYNDVRFSAHTGKPVIHGRDSCYVDLEASPIDGWQESLRLIDGIPFRVWTGSINEWRLRMGQCIPAVQNGAHLKNCEHYDVAPKSKLD